MMDHGQSADENEEPKGAVRLTTPAAFGQIVVVPCIQRLSERYPKLKFELEFTDRYVPLPAEGYDVAICFAAPFQAGIETRRIASYRSTLCASPAYISRRGLPIDPSQVAAHDCIALRTPAPNFGWKVIWGGSLIHFEIAPRVIANDLLAIHDLVLAGVGIAFLPSYLVDDELASEQLADVLPRLETPTIDVLAAFPRYTGRLRKVSALVSELGRHA